MTAITAVERADAAIRLALTKKVRPSTEAIVRETCVHLGLSEVDSEQVRERFSAELTADAVQRRIAGQRAEGIGRGLGGVLRILAIVGVVFYGIVGVIVLAEWLYDEHQSSKQREVEKAASEQRAPEVAAAPCEPEFVADTAGQITIGCPGKGLHVASSKELATFAVKQARTMTSTPYTTSLGQPGVKFVNGVRCHRDLLLDSDRLRCDSNGVSLTVDATTFEIVP